MSEGTDQMEGDERSVLKEDDLQTPLSGRSLEAEQAWEDALGVLYDEAKRTIATWCRDADRSARDLIASAEAARQQAHEEAKQIREDARIDAGRILASAEVQAGQIRSQAQITGADRHADVEVLKARVETMAVAVDQLLRSLEDVMAAVGSLSKPATGRANPAPPRPVELNAADDRGTAPSAPMRTDPGPDRLGAIEVGPVSEHR